MTKKEVGNFIKIMTLNVNGFRGTVDKTKAVSDEICLINMKQIKQLIDKVMINKNDIIVLQEIPHKIKKRGSWDWFDSPLYKSFEEIFFEYMILKPKNLIKSWQCTVAICKKNSSWKQLPQDVLQYDMKNSYGNKFVELQCEDEAINLLGVHMPTYDENSSEKDIKMTEMMWSLLLKSLNNTPYTYVIGDFNANEKKKKPMSGKPQEIRNCGYNHMIPNNIITCYSYETSIDNIYIKSDFTMNENSTVNVEDTKLTDHALCTLEYGC